MITERTKYYDKRYFKTDGKSSCRSIKGKKGYDVKVIDISEISILADYFIIANGSNANQVQAMVDNVEEQMYKAGFDDPKVEVTTMLLGFSLTIMMLYFTYLMKKAVHSIILKDYGEMAKKLI